PRGRDVSTRPPGQLTVEATLRARHAGTPVLVVDDDPVNRESASALLGAVGLKVLLAENGHEALERLAADQPALVLMDLQMPARHARCAAAAPRCRSWR
ncbi:response regulator, partial [Rubrivivax gelatinosus]|uniref:response regulator n=1 Tax=Rubrivivax gelatinosus TaxID=28068 RepID=UPI0021750A67